MKASNMMTWIWDVKEARLECNNIYLTQRSIRDKGTDGQFCMSADEFYSGIHPEDLEQMQDAINKLIAGESISIDEEIRYLSMALNSSSILLNATFPIFSSSSALYGE